MNAKEIEKSIRKERGVTLTALIITIIVLIIVASISITSINGQRDTIAQAAEAKVEAEVATYQEELDIIEIKSVAEQLNDRLDDEGYIDVFQEKVEEDQAFDEAEVTKQSSGELYYLVIITEEGYVFYVYTDEVVYAGINGEFSVGGDLEEGDVTFTCTPTDWTNENVTVTLTLNIETDSTLQYSVGGEDWYDYVEGAEIEVTGNTKVYARLISSGIYGSSVSQSIENIDKLAPNKFTVSAEVEDTTSITISGTTTDASATSESGCSGLSYYIFSKDGGSTYVTSSYTAVDLEGKTYSYTFEGLTEGETYIFAMKAVDNAGNETYQTITKSTTTMPTLSVDDNITLSYSTESWTNEAVTVKVGLSDEIQELVNDGTYTIKYSLDEGTTWETYSSSSGITVSENSTITVKLVSGNIESNEVTEEVTWIDTTKPTITSATPSTDSVTIKATDEASGIVGYTVTTSTSTPSSFTSCSSTTSLSVTIGDLSQTTTYYAWVIDSAGNVSSYKSFTTGTVTDYTYIELNADPSSGWTAGTVTVTATVEDTTTQTLIDAGTYTIMMSTDGSSYTETTSVTVSYNCTVYARLVDSSGQYTGTKSIDVTNIDTTSPSTASLSVTSYDSTSITVKATGADSDSGVAQYVFKIRNKQQ